ncbi:MAG: cation diffusion facilitator family transporter [Candidatus Zixiibacteriota bacterium]
MDTNETVQISREKRAVAFYSILAAIVMIAGKSIVGVITGSLAILTDALHSMLDLGASIVTYFAVRISDKPADSHHHFGHGKVESLAALAQVVILLITCGWIIYEAVSRLMGQANPIALNIWAFIVIIGSIIIDITRVRALKKVARKYKSQALEADALNFSTDIFSSLVVLFGLGAVHFGFVNADAIAAIGVALFIISATVRLGRQSIDVLLDRAPIDIEGQIKEIMTRPREVIRVNNIRLRSDGRTTFAEITLDAERTMSFARASALKKQLRDDVNQSLKDVDVTLSFNPVSAQSEEITEAIDFIVSSYGYPMHHLLINNSSGGYIASMHIEMPGDMSLDEAHNRAMEISVALNKRIRGLKKAIIYTQPAKAHEQYSVDTSIDAEAIKKRIKGIVESFPNVEDCHNLILISIDDSFALMADMRLDGKLTLTETENISREVQEKLRSEIHELVSITLHLEPFK